MRGDTVNPLVEVTSSQLAHFETFGFVRIEGAIDSGTTAALHQELTGEMAAAFDDPTSPAGVTNGRDGFFVPLMTTRTRTSLQLLERAGPVAEGLLGSAALPSYAEASIYFGPTPWHLDNGAPVRSVRFIVYLDELEGDAGALLFLPGSHHPDYKAAFQAYLRMFDVHDHETLVGSLVAMPTVTVPSAVGDLIILDEHVWHCSNVEAARRQWGATYVEAPKTAAKGDLVRRFFGAEFQSSSHRGYDGRRHPYYDEAWLAERPELTRALESAGALAAAEAGAST
jgi:hypothetical protein